MLRVRYGIGYSWCLFIGLLVFTLSIAMPLGAVEVYEFEEEERPAVSSSQVAPDSLPPSIISLLIVPPRDEAVYTLYGHAAIRVQGGIGLADRVYNYGVFDDQAPHFVANFISGRADDYRVVAQYTSDYVYSYTQQGCEVYELVLNLTPQEATKMEELLIENCLPENAYYRYNVVYDNCATRPIAILEQSINGRLQYPDEDGTYPQVSRRAMLDRCSLRWAWLKLGTDLALGMPADQKVGARDQVFLPLYMLDIMRCTHIIDQEGNKRNLVLDEATYTRTAEPALSAPTPIYLHPGSLASLLLLCVLIVCGLDRKHLRVWRILYGIYFAVLGLAGALLFYLSFFSLHPLTNPNLNLLSLHPLHLLLGAPLIFIAPYSRMSYWYHWGNIGLQLVYILLIVFGGLQTPNFAPIAWAIATSIVSFRLIVTRNLKRSGNE